MSEQKHQYYDLAYRAYGDISFFPAKRAQSECDWYDSVCQEFTAAGKEWAIERFTRLFVKSLGAKARCASPMIVGPARFPVARMQKYNQWERNASDAMLAYIEKVRKPAPQPRTELDYGITQKEYSIGAVKVLHNTDENRLQLFFEGKPEQDIISRLKGRGFKWSPRNKAWQRQLTPNAITALRFLFSEAHGEA